MRDRTWVVRRDDFDIGDGVFFDFADCTLERREVFSEWFSRLIAVPTLLQPESRTPSSRTEPRFPTAFPSLPPELPVASLDLQVEGPDASFRLQARCWRREFCL